MLMFSRMLSACLEQLVCQGWALTDDQPVEGHEVQMSDNLLLTHH